MSISAPGGALHREAHNTSITNHSAVTFTSTATVTIITPGFIAGRVTNNTSGVGIPGATVTAGGLTNITDTAGFYNISLVAGQYTVTASATGFVAQSAPGIIVTQGATTTRDFALVTTPVGVRGDLNTLPGVDVGDVLFAAQFVAGVRTPTLAQLALADVNTLPGVDVGDVLFIAQAAAGLRQL
jgi:hypothetical protein